MRKNEIPLHPLLGAMEPGHREALLASGQHQTYRPGQLLLKSGSTRARVLFLLEGAARAHHRSVEGRQVLTQLYRAPALVGDAEALADQMRLEQLTSLDYCVVLAVPRASFLEFLRRDRALAREVAADLARRLVSLSEALKAQGLASIESRLAELLLGYAQLSPRQKGQPEWRIAARLTQQSMADDLGVSLTALIYALQALRKEGLVAKNAARYVLPNPSALESLRSSSMPRWHRSRPLRSAPSTLEEIRVRLPLPIVEAGQAPFYVAQTRGFFASEGLSVQFTLASGGRDPVAGVVNREDAIGVMGGPEALLIARSEGAPVRALALLHRDANFPVLLTLKSSGLTHVKQLRGKRVGLFYGHASTPVLRCFLRLARVRVREVDVGFDYRHLTAGAVDAEWAFRTTAGLDLPAMGVRICTLSPADMGMVTQGYVVFAHEDIADRHADKLGRFMRAMWRGVQAVLSDPSAANRVLLERDPALNAELSLRRLQLYNQVMASPGSPMLERAVFDEAYERLQSGGLIRRPVDVGDLVG